MRRHEHQRTLVVDPREDRQDIAVLAVECSPAKIERDTHVALQTVESADFYMLGDASDSHRRSASISLDSPANWPALDDPRLIDKRLQSESVSGVR